MNREQRKKKKKLPIVCAEEGRQEWVKESELHRDEAIQQPLEGPRRKIKNLPRIKAIDFSFNGKGDGTGLVPRLVLTRGELDLVRSIIQGSTVVEVLGSGTKRMLGSGTIRMLIRTDSK